MKVLHEFIDNIINERKAAGDHASRKDLLSRFMSVDNPDTEEPFTDEYIRDIILNFFIAGRGDLPILLPPAPLPHKGPTLTLTLPQQRQP